MIVCVHTHKKNNLYRHIHVNECIQIVSVSSCGEHCVCVCIYLLSCFCWRRLSLVIACCSVLQCVAVCCIVLQHVAVCCSVLAQTIIGDCMLQCVAMCCIVLQHVAACCSVLQCVGTDYHW